MAQPIHDHYILHTSKCYCLKQWKEQFQFEKRITSRNTIVSIDGVESDISTSDYGDYAFSSERASGDEVVPCPRKKSKGNTSKQPNKCFKPHAMVSLKNQTVITRSH
ncbi:hypothetical protein RRG08_057746 [Elysia crispata]|uniref:Uncharacterized protein n=1 Tax=Elysia crispata TaxID=231223 RepID=A0AAE1CYV6_9GAST|nr:hypothetical protein RRG08_057746 [Elysia crispata]